MDSFQFVLIAWLFMLLSADDQVPVSRIKKLGNILYFIGFVLLFMACFAVPSVRDLFVWYALYPIVVKIVRFGITKITEMSRGLFKRDIVLDDEDAAV